MSKPMYAIIDIKCEDGDTTTFVVAGFGDLSHCRQQVQTITGQRMATDSYQGREAFLWALDMWAMRMSHGVLAWDDLTHHALGWPVDFSWVEGEPEDERYWSRDPSVSSIFAIMAVPAYPTRP